jgi:hypothetical protein
MRKLSTAKVLRSKAIKCKHLTMRKLSTVNILWAEVIKGECIMSRNYQRQRYGDQKAIN